MTPGLAGFVLSVMAFVVAAVTFAVVELIATGTKSGKWGGKCGPNCPICGENDEFGHDSVQLAADESATQK